MSTALLFMLLGVGVGAMYAALAMGVIVAYRGSGVVNFALGAMAICGAVAALIPAVTCYRRTPVDDLQLAD